MMKNKIMRACFLLFFVLFLVGAFMHLFGVQQHIVLAFVITTGLFSAFISLFIISIHRKIMNIRIQNGIYNIQNELFIVDRLNGKEFEAWCGNLLEKLQYTNIQLTPASGDQGADIIATHAGLRYAIQCKNYSSNIGNRPIQEVLSARRIYGCDAMMVMTNSHFTQGGKDAAKANNVTLIDREGLIQMMGMANELFYRSEKATKRSIRKGKRLAKKQIKKEYSEEQLVEYKAHRDDLPHWKMVGEDEIEEG